MTDQPQTPERAVAKLIVGFGSDNIDDVARDAAKRLIKDQFAIQVGASQLRWSKQVRNARSLRPGAATIVADDAKRSAHLRGPP